MGDRVSGPTMAPTLRQRPVPLAYLALLPTPAVELTEVIDRALADNPMLQRSAGGPCASCGRHCASGGLCAACSLQRVDTAALVQPMDWRSGLAGEARLELPVSLYPLLARVVGSLDEQGLLPRPEPDPPALEQVIAALRVVGPPGIAARSPAECVTVQVAALVSAGVLPTWAEGLSAEQLAAGLAGGASGEVLAVLRTIVARVSPRVVLPSADRLPAPPDVTYRLAADGHLGVDVMDAGWFGLGLDETAWSAAGAEGRAWLAPHRRDAVQLLAALRARAGLLGRLALWLGEEQRGFLLDGALRHRRLTRAEAASALGHHPATVGRVVAGKVARCPDGRLIPLAAFFGGRTVVLAQLRRLARENPDASDGQLAQLLTAAGHPVARRTVSKYRALIGIPVHR